MIMRELYDMAGFRIGSTVVNNLRYADDTVIIAESEEQLQRLNNIVVTKSEEKGLYLNCAKSFAMVYMVYTPSILVCILGKSVHLRCKM